MSKKDNVIKSMLSMMDMGVVQGVNSEWYNEAKEALKEDEANINLLLENLQSAIDCTDDYNMFDRSNNKQYFKHEIFKPELAILEKFKSESVVPQHEPIKTDE